MKLQYMNREALDYFKQNIHNLQENFALPTNKWIENEFAGEIFSDIGIDVPDIELDMSEEQKPYLTDAKNVAIIYENLKDISNSIASDERLWSALCLGPFFSYTQYRWGTETVSSIKSHFFFEGSARRALTRNAIARLWWIGRLTYDETRENHYELTEFICEQSSFITDILERNFSNNPKIIRVFIDALLDVRSDGMEIDRTFVREMAKYLNLLGATYILDFLPSDKLKNKLVDRARELKQIPSDND